METEAIVSAARTRRSFFGGGKKKFGAHRRRQTEDIKQLEMKYDFTHI